MQQLMIKSTAAADRPGDLHATLKGGNVLLPERVVKALAPLGIRTALDLIAYFSSFPTQVAEELGWTPEQVQHALKLLQHLLRGSVDDALLHPRTQKQRHYRWGAIPPPGWKDPR